MKIVVIAAVSQNGTIGHQGKIPWHISADLKRFKKLTMDHPIIMGRKTYESIGHPLPGRRNMVLTRRGSIPGIECFTDLTQALKHLGTSNCQAVFVIGGAEVYRVALTVAHTLLLTHVHRDVTGDTKFPEYDQTQWVEVSREDTPECSFVEYRRRE